MIKALNSTQETDTVKYTNYNGQDRTKKITLTNPGALYGLKAADQMNRGGDSSDYVGLYEMIMDKVIASPKLSFEQQDKAIPKKIRTKDLPATNGDGKRVTLHMRFPDVRTAVDMLRVMAKPSGASNLVGTIKSLDDYVFKDANGKGVTGKYWNKGHDGSGLAINAINVAQDYLASVVDFNGFSSVIEKGISFLMAGVHKS